MTFDQIMQAWADGKWLVLAIAAITYLTRLTKPDSKFPIHIQPRWAPFVALFLGQVLATLQALAGGTDWKRAIFNGLVVSSISMGAFDVVAKTIMGDKKWPAWLQAFAFVAADASPPHPGVASLPLAPTPEAFAPTPLETVLVQTAPIPVQHEEPISADPITQPEAGRKATLLPPVRKAPGED